jgi:hypothetical protein
MTSLIWKSALGLQILAAARNELETTVIGGSIEIVEDPKRRGP